MTDAVEKIIPQQCSAPHAREVRAIDGADNCEELLEPTQSGIEVSVGSAQIKSPPDTTSLKGPVEMKKNEPSVAEIVAALIPRDDIVEI